MTVAFTDAVFFRVASSSWASRMVTPAGNRPVKLTRITPPTVRGMLRSAMAAAKNVDPTGTATKGSTPRVGVCESVARITLVFIGLTTQASPVTNTASAAFFRFSDMIVMLGKQQLFGKLALILR